MQPFPKRFCFVRNKVYCHVAVKFRVLRRNLLVSFQSQLNVTKAESPCAPRETGCRLSRYYTYYLAASSLDAPPLVASTRGIRSRHLMALM